MNTVIVNDYSCIQGGAAQVAILSARGLADAGNKVYFIYAVGPADNLLEHENITLVDLSQFDLLSNPSRLNAARIGLWNKAVENKIDDFLKGLDFSVTIVHVHSWVKALSVSAVYSCLKARVPLVITLHDYFTACPNGGFYNYKSKRICTLTPLSRQCFFSNCDSRSYVQKVWRYFRQALTARAGVPSKIHNFIYVSEFSKGILQKYLPNDAKYWSIPNPISICKGLPASPEKSNYFTFVGRLSQEKGIGLLIDSLKSSGVNCRFVGTGELLETAMKELPEAEFTGWADRHEVSSYIINSRALVFPSQWYETHGMVISEAQALGVPCIVSDACAGRDFVQHNETGLWFKSGDERSLSEAINILNQDQSFANKLGFNAYVRYWSSPHTLSNHVRKLTECYKSILMPSDPIVESYSSED